MLREFNEEKGVVEEAHFDFIPPEYGERKKTTKRKATNLQPQAKRRRSHTDGTDGNTSQESRYSQPSDDPRDSFDIELDKELSHIEKKFRLKTCLPMFNPAYIGPHGDCRCDGVDCIGGCTHANDTNDETCDGAEWEPSINVHIEEMGADDDQNMQSPRKKMLIEKIQHQLAEYCTLRQFKGKVLVTYTTFAFAEPEVNIDRDAMNKEPHRTDICDGSEIEMSGVFDGYVIEENVNEASEDHVQNRSTDKLNSSFKICESHNEDIFEYEPIYPVKLFRNVQTVSPIHSEPSYFECEAVEEDDIVCDSTGNIDQGEVGKDSEPHENGNDSARPAKMSDLETEIETPAKEETGD